MTQEQMILTHLQSGKPITPLEALDNYGVFRLASRISDLRKKGYAIQSETVYNNDKHYSQYAMRG